MTEVPTRLLLLEDNPGDALLVQAALADHAPGEFAVTAVERLADALVQIASGRFDAVLCDLGLPDSTGLATAQAIAALSPELPMVVLTGSHDEDLGRASIRHGAQDYLAKGESDGALIARALRYAIERKRLEIGLRVANEALERRVAERTAQLEAAIRKLGTSETRFRELTELSSDWYWEQDENLRFTWFSDGAMLHVGIDIADYVGKTRWELPIDQVTEAQWAEHRRQTQAHLPFRDFQYRWTNRSGGQFYLSISGRPVFDEHGRFSGYHGVGTDITKRRQAELALARQKDLYEVLSQTNQTIMRCKDREELFAAVCRIAVEHGRFRIAWVGLIDKADQQVKLVAKYGEDAGYLDQLRMSMDETTVAGCSITGVALRAGRRGVSNDFLNDPVTAPWHEAALRAGVRAFAAFPIRLGAAVVGAISFYAGEPGYFTDDLLATLDEMAADVSFALDNFEREARRKEAVEALRESEARYRSVFANSHVTMLLIDPADGRIVDANAAACAYYGWDLPALQGMSVKDINTLDPEQVQADLGRTREQQSIRYEFRHRLANGEEREVEVFSGPVEVGGRKLILSVVHDVTERLRVRRELAESENRFRGLVEQSIAGIFIIQDRKFAYVNPRFCEVHGYPSAHELIGMDPLSLVAEEDLAATTEVTRQLLDQGAARISHSLTARRKDGSTVELGVHSARAIYQGRPAIIGMMQDISGKKRAEEQIRRHVAQLEAAFMSTVQVATTLSEMRDPYTAGHERRVAEIAVAIGADLGFDARRLEGLRVAGYLHDIGKITIPSEILSKPGKLSSVEYKLIQGHAQASYDVLKPVAFPWPVALVALQHHERMDGSGYPQGLKGEAILLEARITAVADVIEAMSSHRPYRPGLGIDRALAEIERGRGTAYDANAADACLRLFREKGYCLPT